MPARLGDRPTVNSFLVVSYDISNDKRRTKVMKTLEDFGHRVQYSVFECNLTSAQIETLKRRLRPLVRDQSDSIRFYFLSVDDVARTLIIGSGGISQDRVFYMQ